MFPTARLGLVANRFVAHSDFIDFEGFDFTGATLKMQVRDHRNGGQLRIDLDQVETAAAEGIRIDSVTTTDGVTTTRIAWRINETTIESLPLNAADPDGDAQFEWDMHITPVAFFKFVPASGTYTVKAGVTE